MTSLPRSLTLFQGFDALFHAAECYVNNGGQNRLLDLFAVDAVDKVSKNLSRVLADGNDLEARGNISYAANILCGFTQALGPCTSHHIIAQALGGIFPKVPHGAALIVLAEAYYTRVKGLLPKEFDEIGAVMFYTEKTDDPKANFRNAVIFLPNSVDRSPCGTGTSARVASLFAQGRLGLKEEFLHESVIGTQFKARIIEPVTVGSCKGGVPEVEGSAYITGMHKFVMFKETRFLDRSDERFLDMPYFPLA